MAHTDLTSHTHLTLWRLRSFGNNGVAVAPLFLSKERLLRWVFEHGQCIRNLRVIKNKREETEGARLVRFRSGLEVELGLGLGLQEV